MQKRTLSCILAIALVVTLSTLGSAQKKRPLIAFSQCAMNHPWRVAMTNDIEFWAKKYGVDLVWNDGEGDAATQLSKVKDLLLKNPDALILSPFQSAALTPVKAMCDEKKIPLICIDRGLSVEPGTGMYISFIGKDNAEISEQLGAFVRDYLKRTTGAYKGNVVEIQEVIGSSAAIERHEGFKKALAKYPNIKIVASLSGNGNRADAVRLMENYLERFPKGQIDIVYTHSDEMGLGALQAIKAAGRTELIGRLVTIDGQRAAIKTVVDGEHLAIGDYAPYFAEAAIKAALDYIDGKPVKSVIMLPSNIYHTQTPSAKDFVNSYYKRMVAEDRFY